MKKLIVLTLLFTALHFTAKSEIYQLDLGKSIEIAKEKSIRMAKLAEDLKIADNNLKSATSRLKTHVNLELTTPQFSRSIQRDYRSNTLTYYSDKSLFYSGALSISQPLPTAGSISLVSGLSNKNYYYLKKQEPSLYSYINLVQPLNALYGYNEISSSLKIAKLNYESSKKRYKRRELDLIYDVSNAFYNAISVQKASEIAKLNLDRQKEAYETNKRKYEAGLIKEVDALKMEVDLDQAQNDYELAVLNQNSAMTMFKTLIGIQLSDSINLSSELKYETVIVDPEKAVQLALQNRLEIREQEITVEQNKLNIKEQKSKGMIQSSLNASFGKQGVGNDGLDANNNEIPISINSSLTRAFNQTYSDFTSRGPTYGIGLTIKVPILDGGGNRANVRIAESTLKQSLLDMDETKRAIEQEVRNLVADLNSSLKRLQLLEKTVNIAEKSFEITRQRFAEGDVTSEEMALERARLNTTYNSHLSAYSTYQLKLADLTRKTFYDFKTDQPIK